MAIKVTYTLSEGEKHRRISCGKMSISDSCVETIVLRLGNKNPFRAGDNEAYFQLTGLITAETVFAVVDGKELAVIRTHMKNLKWPIHKVEPVFWTGDDAKFIALNFDF